jgi:hypothetical protein
MDLDPPFEAVRFYHLGQDSGVVRMRLEHRHGRPREPLDQRKRRGADMAAELADA